MRQRAKWSALGLILAVGLVPAPVRAQENVELSDRARISVLTILPGDEVYSAFGHSAFRMLDPVTGFDLVYNYGTFDFKDPLFVPRFAYGALDYLLSLSSMRTALLGARVQERTVIEQVLDLSQADRDALFEFLRVNARPENRAYRYDFLFDNCATRLRDGVERVVGERLVWSQSGSHVTFRHHLDPYLAASPWLDLGIDLVMGSQTDRVADAREAQFLPLELYRALDGASVLDGDVHRPLVTRRDTIIAFPERTHEPTSWPIPTLLGWLLSIGVFLAAGSWKPVWSKWDAWLFALLGVLGLFFAVMWLGTLHHVTAWNLNLLWALPTHVLFVWIRPRISRHLIRGYLGLTLVLAAVSLLSVTGSWLLPQAIPGPFVPIVLLVMIRAAAVAYGGRSTR